MKRPQNISIAVHAGSDDYPGLARNITAAAIMEFALVAAPFFALLVAITETSLTYFAQQVLETITQQAARTLVTGTAQTDATMNATSFKASVCSTLPAMMSCRHLLVDVQSATSFAQINTARPTITFDSTGAISNNWKYNTGNAGDIVIMRTMYVWPVVAGPLSFDISNMPNGKRLLIATHVFKTEQYK